MVVQISATTVHQSLRSRNARNSFTEEIALWVGNQRLDAALAREELAQLEGVQRFLALCKNLLVSVITICPTMAMAPAS
jgi:hypothetical protein